MVKVASIMSSHLHPAVLITVLPRDRIEGGSVSRQLSSKESPVPLSGSGFLIGKDINNGHSLVITAGAWLSQVLDINTQKDSNHSIVWKYDEDVKSHKSSSATQPRFAVLLETLSQGSRATRQVEASMVAACLMKDVFSALKEGLESMSHWRLTVGEMDSVITDSLLIPLSCVVVLKINTTVIPTYHLNISLHPLSVGQPVVTMGTPFGAFCPEVFFNCVVPGNINKSIGSSNKVWITDASLPGGGSLVVARRSDSTSQIEVLGMIIAGLSLEKGQPSGLSLVCCAHSIWKTLADCDVKTNFFAPPLCSTPSQALSPSLLRTCHVVLVLKDGQWGTGVLISTTAVLTCGHVVSVTGKGDAIVTQNGRKLRGQVIASSSLPDYAIIKLQEPINNSLFSKNLPLCELSVPPNFDYGDPAAERNVCIIGYGFQDPYMGILTYDPLITRGAIIKVVRGSSGEPVMFVTTAVLLPGMSGGLVVDELSGKPLGIAVSNSKDLESDASYPRLNYCLAFSWILPQLLQFLKTNDSSWLEGINSSGKEYSDIWRLAPQYGLYSKL